MTHTQKSTFHALINFHGKRDQNSPLATKRILKWVIYNVKGYLNPRWPLVMIIVHVLRFGNGPNEELQIYLYKSSTITRSLGKV